MPTYDLAKCLSKEIISVWKCASVPTATLDNVSKRVAETINMWNGKNRSFDSTMGKEFQDEFDKLLDIKPKPKGRGGNEERELEYLRDLMRQSGKRKKRGGSRPMTGDGGSSSSDWETDYNFYLDQYKGTRQQVMGDVDNKLSKKEKQSTKETHLQQKDNDDAVPSAPGGKTEPVNNLAGQTSQSDTGSGADADFNSSQKWTPKGDHITISLPRKKLIRETTELSVRLGLSVTKQMTAKLIKLGGGNLKDVTLSKTCAKRHRKSELEIREADIKEELLDNLPRCLGLHWDGKIIKYSLLTEEDRLCIKVSFPGSERSDQFLAAPLINPPDGKTMALTIVKTLDNWDIQIDNIIAMCWDTTASNTGVHKGSATLFEKYIKKAILWLGCRHHIGEVPIRHVNIRVRGPTKGPTDPMFLALKKKMVLFH